MVVGLTPTKFLRFFLNLRTSLYTSVTIGGPLFYLWTYLDFSKSITVGLLIPWADAMLRKYTKRKREQWHNYHRGRGGKFLAFLP